MDKEGSSWTLPKGFQYRNISKGVTCEVVLWYERKKGVMPVLSVDRPMTVLFRTVSVATLSQCCCEQSA